MNTIWKFPFKIQDSLGIEMPIGAQPIHVAVQGETPCLWAIVNPAEVGRVYYKFHLVGTGHPLDERYTKDNHVGSFLIGNDLVFHLFCE